jgi:2-polyprenyl-3-methyl-5-hydroxy-6-metoxy-1,4-benzoquinol methylase
MTVNAERTAANVVPCAAGAFRGRFVRMFDRAMEQNLACIDSLLAARPGAVLLDLGCDDGANTARFAAAARAAETHGLELIEERGELAVRQGIQVRIGDLDQRFPYDDGSFDVVVSNQVIEHLCDTDNFVRESYRVLRPGGLAVVSTENLASWHNIGALMFGWQPFSLTNVSDRRLGIGNPLAIHRGEQLTLSSWQHVRVFAHRGLRELYEAHGFIVETIRGAGYYPLPRWLARADGRHAAFLTMSVVRPRTRSGAQRT